MPVTEVVAKPLTGAQREGAGRTSWLLGALVLLGAGCGLGGSQGGAQGFFNGWLWGKFRVSGVWWREPMALEAGA